MLVLALKFSRCGDDERRPLRDALSFRGSNAPRKRNRETIQLEDAASQFRPLRLSTKGGRSVINVGVPDLVKWSGSVTP
jgi:hypothetical protein